jgi:hypothetical protein
MFTAFFPFPSFCCGEESHALLDVLTLRACTAHVKDYHTPMYCISGTIWYYPVMALRYSNPQNATLTIRLYAHELEDIKKAAKRAKKPVAVVVRETMKAWANGHFKGVKIPKDNE